MKDVFDPIALIIFANRLDAICEEMGAQLRKAAFSPNIRDRLDYSCAIFNAKGLLCAQAAHIPVHLGSMAYAMEDVVEAMQWAEGDMVILNDPFKGGTHLPDVTVIAPVFSQNKLIGFVVNRAHHADIGADSPGSMPISQHLEEEGILIEPSYLMRKGELNREFMQNMLAGLRSPAQSQGDFNAQISANLRGVQRLCDLIAGDGALFNQQLTALNAYADRLAEKALGEIPEGAYHFADSMDSDGLGGEHIPIQLKLTVKDAQILADFSGTAAQVQGNINCPLSVAAAGVFYVLRCLMPAQTPACAGAFQRIRIAAPEGSLLNAQYPAAVAAGNVETSTRVVDVMMGALAQAIPEKMPGMSHGSMNNLAMGADNATHRWDYYETMGGGMGAGANHSGQSAVQTHMTNTLNTPIEVLESHYPLRVTEYSLRRGSGGQGKHVGGDGLIREFEFTAAAQATLLTERRLSQPCGAAGGGSGLQGENTLNQQVLLPKQQLVVKAGDKLKISTPGGGGFAKTS